MANAWDGTKVTCVHIALGKDVGSCTWCIDVAEHLVREALPNLEADALLDQAIRDFGEALAKRMREQFDQQVGRPLGRLFALDDAAPPGGWPSQEEVNEMDWQAASPWLPLGVCPTCGHVIEHGSEHQPPDGGPCKGPRP